MKYPEPRFENPCNTCTYLGHWKEWDLYAHKLDEDTTYFIARQEDGPILISHMTAEITEVPLSIARARYKHDEPEENEQW